MSAFMIVFGIIMSLALVAAAMIPFCAPVQAGGRHRATRGRLALQEAQRAEREAEHARAVVREWAAEHGERRDWKLV